MHFKRLSAYGLFAVSIAALTPACTAATEEQAAVVAPAAPGLNLKQGQYLSIVLPQAKTGAEDARKAYYKSAFTLADQFGLQREAMLTVENIIISDYEPGAVIFYSYPDKAAETGLANHPDWPAIKALRPAAWDELKIYSAPLAADLNLPFKADKSYTLVVAWTNPDNPEDYQLYLKGIEQAVNQSGGRFVYKMIKPQFEAHAAPSEAPGQLTFVEWDTLDGFTNLSKNPVYQETSKRYFTPGVKKVEFYRLAVPAK